MSRTTRALICLALALPMSFGANAALAQSPSPDPVLDQELSLTSMAGKAVAPDAGITAIFAADATLSGSGGCNQYSATWQSDGTTLTISPILATRMACDPAVDALEAQYIGLLQDAVSWSLDGSALEIVTSDGSTLVYGGDAAGPSLVGAWALSSVDGSAVPAGITATAVFGADGSLTGSGGCNTFDGTYTADGSALTVGPLSATRMFCETGSQVESAYLDALQGATSWAVAGTTLTLTGTATLVFGTGNSSSATLTGQPWALVTIGGETVDPSLGVSATFGEDGTISGSGGCNEYSASYTVDGESLTVDSLLATRKSCATTANDTEAAFLNALGSATSFTISGADLLIATTDGTSLEFQAQGGPPPSPGTSAAPTMEPEPTVEPSAEPTASATPAGSPGATAGIVGSWKMTEILGSSTSLVPTFKATIAFADDGTFSGFGGCNDFSGTWALAGTALALSGVDRASSGDCDALSKQLEDAFFQLVPLINSATVTDGKLFLSGSMTGGQGFTYEPAS